MLECWGNDTLLPFDCLPLSPSLCSSMSDIGPDSSRIQPCKSNWRKEGSMEEDRTELARKARQVLIIEGLMHTSTLSAYFEASSGTWKSFSLARPGLASGTEQGKKKARLQAGVFLPLHQRKKRDLRKTSERDMPVTSYSLDGTEVKQLPR